MGLKGAIILNHKTQCSIDFDNGQQERNEENVKSSHMQA